MTTHLLVRHASAAHLGRWLAGRAPGLHLDDVGRAQATSLARRLRNVDLAAVYTGPLERARETAVALADARGLEPVVCTPFDEVDYGLWTGRTFEELEGDPVWTEWNRARGTARVPCGESMRDVLARALDGMRAIGTAHPDATVAIVSHCDVIRPLLAHFRGMHLDHLLRLDVAPASVHRIVCAWGSSSPCASSVRSVAGDWSR